MLHYFNVRVTRQAEGQSSSRRIFELPEDKAKDAGAVFLGEVIVFSLTGTVVAWQIYASQKAAKLAEQQGEMTEQLRQAEKRAETQQREMRLDELERNLNDVKMALDLISQAIPFQNRSGSDQVRHPVEQVQTIPIPVRPVESSRRDHNVTLDDLMNNPLCSGYRLM
jgi:hypothetical protein